MLFLLIGAGALAILMGTVLTLPLCALVLTALMSQITKTASALGRSG